jgi:hypothetical protein
VGISVGARSWRLALLGGVLGGLVEMVLCTRCVDELLVVSDASGVPLTLVSFCAKCRRVLFSLCVPYVEAI